MEKIVTVFLGYFTIFSLLFASLTISQASVSAPTCSDIINKVYPCLLYVNGTSASPSADCCNGVKSASSEVKTHDDAVAACTCLKNEMAGLKYDASRTADLPKKCGVNLQMPPLTSSVDCSKAEPPLSRKINHH